MIRRWLRTLWSGEEDVSRRLIVGLGNPGRKYEGTRHNIGFDVLRRLGERYRLSLTQKKFSGVFTTGSVAGEDVVLVEPHTFMNKSGKSVQAARQFYSVDAEDLIVLHDEIDLEPGTIRIKEGGGHGGHNGLRDIISRTGDRDFVRIRLGVGRPEHGDVTNHVLSRFSGSERDLIAEMVEDACDAIETVLTDGVSQAQNRFH